MKACVNTNTHLVVTYASACSNLLSFPWSAYLTDIFLSWVSSSETVPSVFESTSSCLFSLPDRNWLLGNGDCLYLLLYAGKTTEDVWVQRSRDCSVSVSQGQSIKSLAFSCPLSPSLSTLCVPCSFVISGSFFLRNCSIPCKKWVVMEDVLNNALVAVEIFPGLQVLSLHSHMPWSRSLGVEWIYSPNGTHTWAIPFFHLHHSSKYLCYWH